MLTVGKIAELHTYFDLRKAQVVNILYSARLSLTVNKTATLIVSSRDAAKLGMGYIRVHDYHTL
jgi:hypothetical protein